MKLSTVRHQTKTEKDMFTVSKSSSMKKFAFVLALSIATMPFIGSTRDTMASADHSKFQALLTKHVTSSGRVNYEGFKKDKSALEAYLKDLSSNVPGSSASKNAKLAYWMNAYNAFTIKLVVDNYPVKSIKDIAEGKPWNKKFISLGGKTFDLNTIEHEILRKLGDPRIHVGINCASISCPKLSNKAFTESNVNAELARLTKEFVNDKSRNQLSSSSLKLSKIFEWFKDDFTTNGSLISWINKYSNVKINSDAKISYMTYNWNLNK